MYFELSVTPSWSLELGTKSMLTKMNMRSVNQINAQIKLNEMWKSTHVINSPIKISIVSRSDEVACTRAITQGHLKEELLTNSSQRTFLNYAIHIWNKAPIAIKQSKSLSCAKKAI